MSMFDVIWVSWSAVCWRYHFNSSS